jgi:hypothetical protein
MRSGQGWQVQRACHAAAAARNDARAAVGSAVHRRHHGAPVDGRRWPSSPPPPHCAWRVSLGSPVSVVAPSRPSPTVGAASGSAADKQAKPHFGLMRESSFRATLQSMRRRSSASASGGDGGFTTFTRNLGWQRELASPKFRQVRATACDGTQPVPLHTAARSLAASTQLAPHTRFPPLAGRGGRVRRDGHLCGGGLRVRRL